MFKILNLNLKHLIKFIPLIFVLSVLSYSYKYFRIFIFLIPWILIISFIKKEAQNKINVLFCSLPLKRNEIVQGTYLSAFVYNVISTIYSAFIYYVIYNNGINSFNLTDVLYNVFLPIILTLALLLPLHFKFGFNLDIENVRLTSIFIIIPVSICLLFLFIYPLCSTEDFALIAIIKENLYTFNLIALILFYLSMQLSETLYKTREF